ncbi:DNA-directed RNA polymerase I subunit RPA43 [Chelonus insularis]|uniref:DNA-directed RNA polymerase I subunit RPA43 n=1 Tax=Chelonus insularis TaxID=460826 RepID=UPI00158A252C|nr:DNA-directed RNA polymerase I subunit RPA43 [Chelonus insularis]
MCIYINKMKPRILLGITWSIEELKKLVNDKNSCVSMQRSRKHVALHPIHLNDLNKAFQGILDSSINIYDPQFKGLLLAYKNPKLISQLGTILYDSHFIHVDIEADFYVFQPQEQCVLTGVVNKKADNYIGVLVHKVFNVSIPKKEEENWEGHYLEVGDDVTFTIEHVDLKGKLPFIRGQLLPSGKSTHHLSNTASSHQFFNSDEELDNDNTEKMDENKEPNKPKRLSFLGATNSDLSDEETRSVNKVTKDKNDSNLLECSFQNEEEICEKQSSLESTITTRDEDENDSVLLNGTEKSKKLSKKDKKKRSKDKERHVENENNTLTDDSTFNHSKNPSVIENEISIKKSKKRKHKDTEENSFSEPSPKIRKHKKKRSTPEDDEQSSINDEGNKLFSENDKTETPKMLVEEKTSRKSSKKKHREKIKVEQNNEQIDFNETETNSISFNNDIEYSKNSSQEEQPPHSPKKSSKHKSKLKEKIKEEQPNSPVNRTTELSQSERDQTDDSFLNNFNNYTNLSQDTFTESFTEVPTKSTKKKKRKSTSENFLAVKIKEEPVSDAESSFSKKSKRKQKDRENIDDSLDNLDTEILETNSSQHKKKKDKKPVNDVSIGKIKVKQEVIVKEEFSKKKKHKEGNQSTWNIKQEFTSSDVEGTAVKKKIKTLFTE